VVLTTDLEVVATIVARGAHRPPTVMATHAMTAIANGRRRSRRRVIVVAVTLVDVAALTRPCVGVTANSAWWFDLGAGLVAPW